MKRKFGMLSALIPAAIMLWYGGHAVHAAYADVPEGALGNEVKKAVDYGLMNGLSNTVFGYSAPMTRAQFVTVLDRMLLSKADKTLLAQTENAPLPDTMNLPDTFPQAYYTALSHAVACDVVETSVPFRPNEPVTREAMAEMLVKALGLDNAALSLSSNRKPIDNRWIFLIRSTIWITFRICLKPEKALTVFCRRCSSINRFRWLLLPIRLLCR